tara:strand:+ start:31193 stop:31717 length:525 start_codon:yes stop_codon:yes gene_type:complete
MDIKHYNQKPLRNAKFITPPNVLKAKVGVGGLADAVLERAQKLLENHTEDFRPLGEIYLNQMKDGIDYAIALNKPTNSEDVIARILFPCVQLKANGGMFHYPLITRIAERFVQFMEVVENLDEETLDIALAFHTTMKIVVASSIKGDGGDQGEELVNELNSACMRYFGKHNDII